MDTHSAVVRELVDRLRRLEDLYQSSILSQQAEQQLVKEIRQVKDKLHVLPEETPEQVERRIGRKQVVAVDRQYEEMLDALDTAAEERLEGVKSFLYDVPEMEPSEQDVAEEKIRQLVRRRGKLGPQDLELIEADLVERQMQPRKRKLEEEEEKTERPKKYFVGSRTLRSEEIGGTEIDDRLRDELDALQDYAEQHTDYLGELESELDDYVAVNRQELDRPEVRETIEDYRTRIEETRSNLDELERQIRNIDRDIRRTEVPTLSEEESVSLFQRATEIMQQYPTGVHYNDIAARIWEERGGDPEDVKARSREFLNFTKSVNKALRRPRMNSPIVYLKAIGASKGRGTGRYILKEFVDQDNIEEIVHASKEDAQNRGLKNFDESVLRLTLMSHL
jgi:hypothetical protein